MPQFESGFFSSLIFWEILSFGILFFVLYKFAFPGILAALEEREKKIKDSLDQAERHRAESERALKTYEAKLSTAAKEAEAILAAAQERAQRLLDENEQRMSTEAERIKGDATREIDHERRKAIQDIRNQTTELALAVAEKVVQRSLTDADHRKFADEALSALSKSHS
ncbi:F0F1 ATP synthase subunit B [Nitrospira lenta]|uniref:ATP synthase subunit b n=1 Tax=Nitrospira lenta TaxID=1436998 RepID=A0A330LDL6_9BACT|nr:F0F1 ATP synthase subunit B [Nitrospira lenta]SPP65019.1 ATP synthase subunit b [Nitrospira lenta]